ncbi:hypothetical protein LTR08_002669 [Meristemomyces frigidus]|nr:hypothetical protein LTR08_002669 [Meristemomyces frigidus]
MAAANQMQTALLTEHFRYTPLTLLDDIINTVNELVFRAVNAIEEGLTQARPEQLGFALPPASDTASTDESRSDARADVKQNEVDAGIVQLESLLNATVDKDFDKFEIYTLRNILAVGHGDEGAELARWVRLEHYKHLDLDGAGAGHGAVSPEAVQMQRRKLHETQKLNALLRAEEAQNTAVLSQLHQLMGTAPAPTPAPMPSAFAFLNPSPATTTTPSLPLTQDTTYTLTHLPFLRALLAKLHAAQHTPAPAQPNSGKHHPDEDSREAKRTRYLDAQAQRAVARRGVDTSAHAMASAGRKVGREEVEGVEDVVQALGGAGRGREEE